MRQHASKPIGTAALILASLAVIVAALIYVPRLLRAASVLYGFSERRPPLTVALYNKFFGYATERTDASIPGAAGPIAVRIYTPVGRQHPANIVIVHGFAPDGNRSGKLNSLADVLARRGYRVVLPTLPAEQHILISKSDLSVIGDTIRWTAISGQTPVSVFGISFGGGLSTAAAELPEVRPYVRLVFSISGYNNLATIGQFFTREPVRTPDGGLYPQTFQPGTAMIFVRQYLDEMVPPADLPVLRDTLEEMVRTQHYPIRPGDPLLSRLSEEQQRELFDLQMVETDAIKTRYANVIRKHRAAMERVSPVSVLPTLDLPLYVLHGSADPSIPPQEVLWMESEVPKDSDSHFLVTPWMEHATVGNAVSLWERLRVGFFLTEVLARAAG